MIPPVSLREARGQDTQSSIRIVTDAFAGEPSGFRHLVLHLSDGGGGRGEFEGFAALEDGFDSRLGFLHRLGFVVGALVGLADDFVEGSGDLLERVRLHHHRVDGFPGEVPELFGLGLKIGRAHV